MAAFYLPVVILCTVYHRIYRETRRHQRKLYELQAFRPPQSGRTGSGNAADETGNRGCLGACGKRLVVCGCRQRECGCCGVSAERDRVEGSFDCAEGRLSGTPDDVQPASRTASMSKSQSAPGETHPTTVVNSVSPLTGQSRNSTVSSLVAPGQCQCSWHGGTPRENVAASSSSSQHPAFVLTVEFAGSSGEVNATTADEEGPWETCLSTEEPDDPYKHSYYM